MQRLMWTIQIHTNNFFFSGGRAGGRGRLRLLRLRLRLLRLRLLRLRLRLQRLRLAYA